VIDFVVILYDLRPLELAGLWRARLDARQLPMAVKRGIAMTMDPLEIVNLTLDKRPGRPTQIGCNLRI
jgi:hypothetical protein